MSDLSSDVINFCLKNDYIVDVQASDDYSVVAYFPAQLDRGREANYYRYELFDENDHTLLVKSNQKYDENGKSLPNCDISLKFPTLVSRLVVYQDIIITTQDLDIPIELILCFKYGELQTRITDIWPKFKDEEMNERQDKVALLFHKICLSKNIIELEGEIGEDEEIQQSIFIMLNVLNERGIY